MKIIKNRKMKALIALATLLPSFATTISAQNHDRAFEVARQIDWETMLEKKTWNIPPESWPESAATAYRQSHVFYVCKSLLSA